LGERLCCRPSTVMQIWKSLFAIVLSYFISYLLFIYHILLIYIYIIYYILIYVVFIWNIFSILLTSISDTASSQMLEIDSGNYPSSPISLLICHCCGQDRTNWTAFIKTSPSLCDRLSVNLFLTLTNLRSLCAQSLLKSGKRRKSIRMDPKGHDNLGGPRR
jgi:hypothetical protein